MYSLGNMKKLPFKHLRHSLTTPFVKVIILLTACSPRFLNRLNASIMGHVLALLPLPSNRVIKSNQKKIEKSHRLKLSTSAIYTNMINGYFDFFYLSRRSNDTFSKIVKIDGLEHLEKALEAKKGVIAVTAHLGPWELLPRALKQNGFDIAVIGRSLKQKSTSEILEKLRQKPGVVTIDRDRAAAPILRTLKKNNIVGMLIDQATRGVQNEQISFLGKPAATPVSPALFAKKLNTPIVTMHIKQNNDSTYLLKIDEPFLPKPEDTTEQILSLLNNRICSWITEAPNSWVWFHKRWKKIRKSS